MPLPSERLQQVFTTTPTWYQDPEFQALHKLYFAAGEGSESSKQTEKLDPAALAQHEAEKWEVINWFAAALARNLILLGTVKQGYNDDDRQGKYENSSAVPVDTVVIHHTTTAETLTLWQLEAISFLRLYLPHFMAGASNGFISFLLQTHPELTLENLAPASGHYLEREGRAIQSFSGYHFLIYPDGTVVEVLDHDYMGFHAGNLKVNNRSLGIAMVGTFTETAPTAAAQAALTELLERLQQEKGIQYLASHKSVRIDHTVCPGTWFEEFAKKQSLPLLGGR